VDPLRRLLDIMERLRDPEGGCPWDVAQDFASIAPYTIEEAYEVEDAIRRGDMDGLREELGDLLLQVVFHAQMAREAGHFAFDDVAATLCEKLVRRHPHVFGEAEVADAEAQTRAWEEHKAAERAERAAAQGAAPPSAFDDVALGLPALLRAQKLVRRAARAGLEAETVIPGGPALVAAQEQRLGVAPAGERAERLGDWLLAAVVLAARQGVEAEDALRAAAARFEARCRATESERGTQAGAAEASAAPAPEGEAW
jgi:MazG family protein